MSGSGMRLICGECGPDADIAETGTVGYTAYLNEVLIEPETGRHGVDYSGESNMDDDNTAEHLYCRNCGDVLANFRPTNHTIVDVVAPGKLVEVDS